METKTWTPGSNPVLDSLFDELRERQYQNRTHHLWKNYSKQSFENVAALTICYDTRGIPELCSSILERPCWPKGAFRILNRLWKNSNKIPYPKVMSASFAESVRSQISWLKENTDCNLYFISRQSDNWEDWVIKNFSQSYNLEFYKTPYKYLTCPNECDDTCWQKIIYNGDNLILEQWQRKQF